MSDAIESPQPAYFRVQGLDGSFFGWTEGETWHGHALPLFSLEVGKAIVLAYDRVHHGNAAYDAEADVFRFGMPPAEYAPVARDIGNRVEKLYPIGARHWPWQQLPE